MKTGIEALTAEFWAWVREHAGESAVSLAPEARKVMDADTAALALTQVQARHKARGKLGPLPERCPEFLFPSALLAEQCTAWAVARFNAQAMGIMPGTSLLDITFGLGLDAFAAAEAGARVTGVDIDAKAARAGRHNAAALGLDVCVHCADAIEWMGDAKERGERFDVVFADPARRREGGGRAYAFSDCRPDLGRILMLAPKVTGRLVVKASPMLDVDAVMRVVPQANMLWCVGLRGECKEILLVCDFGSAGRELGMAELDGLGDAVTLRRSWPRQSSGRVPGTLPQEGAWLCLPSAALAKARLQGVTMERWTGLLPVREERSIYTAGSRPEGFPGRCLYINKMYGSLREAARALKGEAANVACFDYGLTPEALCKKLGLRPLGDDSRLVVGLLAGRRRLVLDCLNG